MVVVKKNMDLNRSYKNKKKIYIYIIKITNIIKLNTKVSFFSFSF